MPCQMHTTKGKTMSQSTSAGCDQAGEQGEASAAHFAGHLKSTDEDATIDTARKMVEVSVLWKGDPIHCMKSFGSKTCALCMQERLETLRRAREGQESPVNSNNELHGTCWHKMRFHWLTLPKDKNLSTDDRTGPERVPSFSRTPSPSSIVTPPPDETNACRLIVDVDAARADV